MIKKQLWFIIMCLIAAMWLVPFYSSVTVSLKPLAEIMEGSVLELPKTLFLGNFTNAWNTGVKRYLLNSFIIVFPSVIGAMLLSSLAAHALAQYRFKGNELILMGFLAFNLLPQQILIIPLYRLSHFLKIHDTYLAVILYHISFQTGFCTFFLRSFMRTIPSTIMDAARIDGVSELGLYWRINLPLIIPALAALGILEFTWIWNDFLWGTVLLKSDSLKPVTVGIQNLQGVYTTAWGMQNAGALMAVLPTVLVFLFLQRYFVKGLFLGAIR